MRYVRLAGIGTCILTLGCSAELPCSVVTQERSARPVPASVLEQATPLRVRVSVEDLRQGVLHPPDAGEHSAARLVAADRSVGERDPVDPRILQRYWVSHFRRLSAENGQLRVSATRLIPEIKLHRSARDTLTVPVFIRGSASMPPAPPVTYTPEAPEELSAYVDTLTVITGLALLGDSTVFVELGQLRAGRGRPMPHVATDGQVFLGRRHLASGIAVEGQLFAYSESSLFYLKPHARPDSLLLVEIPLAVSCAA